MKKYISIIILAALAMIAYNSFSRENKKKENLRENGIRVVGHVVDKKKPYKSNWILKYTFEVSGREYSNTSLSDANYPTNVGDKRVVVYDPVNPSMNKLLLHEAITEDMEQDDYKDNKIIFR